MTKWSLHLPGRSPAVSLAALCCLSFAAASHGEPATRQSLDQEVEQLKEDVLSLDRDMTTFDRELRHPSQARFAVFLAVDVERRVNIEEVSLWVDQTVVSLSRYNPAQQYALGQGGVQRFHLGNLSRGRHAVQARFKAKGPGGQTWEGEASISVLKHSNPTLVILQIVNAGSQPQLRIAEWAL